MQTTTTITLNNNEYSLAYNTQDPLVQEIVKLNKQMAYADKCKLVRMLRNRLKAAINATQPIDYSNEEVVDDMMMLSFAEKDMLQ